MYRGFFLGSVALVAAFGAGMLTSKHVDAQANLLVVKEVVRDEMKGMDGWEVIAQYTEQKPGAAVPWHIHPDSHEITVVVEGTTTLEVEGRAKSR